MPVTNVAAVANGKKRLIGVFVVLLVVAFCVGFPWWNAYQTDNDVRQEHSPATLGLGYALIDSLVLACAVLGCAVQSARRPIGAFAVASLIGVACVIWGLRDFFMIGEAATIAARHYVNPYEAAEFTRGFISVVFPSSIGFTIIGTLVLCFSLPALKAARRLKEDGLA